MKMPIFISIILTLFIQHLNAQVNQQWIQRYNGPGSGYDNAYSVAVDVSGNVYVTGASAGSGYDYTTLKYNSAGAEQWAARYNGPGNDHDYAISIAVDGSGNVYVTGYSTGNGTNSDYATIKYNSYGVQQWIKRYNGPGNNWDQANSIAVDGSGNVYVTGHSYSGPILYSADYATIKYNSAGDSLWVQRYNGSGNGYDEAKSVAVDALGNVYVTGQCAGSGAPYYATIKYNSSGVQQWVQRYNGPGNGGSGACSLTLDGSGNVYVTGTIFVYGTYYDYATIKYNSSGDSIWVKRYNGPGSDWDQAKSIAVDALGNVYVTGESRSSTLQGSEDYATIKYNSAGVQQWVARYNGPGDSIDNAYSLSLDNWGNIYVTGRSIGTSFPNYDYATIKYNSSGIEQWVQRYNGPGSNWDQANSISVDGSGNVYVTGLSRSIIGYDYATIKYSQMVSIQPINHEIPSKFNLSQNYPNPFNPNTVIRFQLPVNSVATIRIFDALGREVTTLVNEQLQAGTYEVEWDATNFPSGVYYYRLQADKFSETKKMVLIK